MWKEITHSNFAAHYCVAAEGHASNPATANLVELSFQIEGTIVAK